MRRRIAIGVGVLLALLVLMGYLGRALGPGSRPRFPSSLAPEPEGLLAFRRLLEQLEVPTEVLSRPWDAFASTEPRGVLLLATPLQRAPDREEREALRSWIERGGALIVIDDATELERSPALDRLLNQFGLPARLPVSDLDPGTMGLTRPTATEASGTPARPSDAALKRVLLSERGIPLAVGDNGGVVAAAIRHGRGRVVRVVGALVSNDRISRGENLTFALRLTDDLRGEGTVWFDEYHHGFGGLLAVRRLDRSALAWSALQALLVTVLFGFARGVRFGPMRVEPAPERRSSLEFVHSMASLYQRAGARAHVVQGALDRFVREARACLSLGEDLDTEGLARTVAGRRGLPTSRVTQTLRAAEQAILQTRISERTMIDCVRELARLEQEAFGERDAYP
jgi:hypothetical protein